MFLNFYFEFYATPQCFSHKNEKAFIFKPLFLESEIPGQNSIFVYVGFDDSPLIAYKICTNESYKVINHFLKKGKIDL